jgi:hypothetical protein
VAGDCASRDDDVVRPRAELALGLALEDAGALDGSRLLAVVRLRGAPPAA